MPRHYIDHRYVGTRPMASSTASRGALTGRLLSHDLRSRAQAALRLRGADPPRRRRDRAVGHRAGTGDPRSRGLAVPAAGSLVRLTSPATARAPQAGGMLMAPGGGQASASSDLRFW